MGGSISARRSRATLGTRESTEERDAWCVVRGDRGGLYRPALRKSASGHYGDARAQRVRLESGRPRGLHERLRARLAHELRLRRPRRVRLAAAVRPLPEDVLRPRQVALLARVRGGARPPARARPGALHGALQAAAARFRDGQRAVHAHSSEARRSLADSARPHVFGSEVTHRASRIPHPGLLLMFALAGCKGSGEGVIALEGATLIGKTVVPGFVDAHAHVERWAAERYVAWGVTTVRDLGAASTDSSIALRNDFNLGSVLGPRMFTSGAMIDGLPPTYATATAVRSRAD